MNISILRSPEELEKRLLALAAMRGCHFAILDSGIEAMSADIQTNGNGNGLSSLLTVLRQHHFKLVSRVAGGYAACHRQLIAMERRVELIDHDPNICFECSGRYSGLRKEKTNIFDTVRKLAVNMRSRVETLNSPNNQNERDGENVRVDYREYHIPESVSIMNPSISSKLLLTILNDRSSEDESFVDALGKLSDLVFSFAIESLNVNERLVNTATHGLYAGVQYQSLYSITFTSMDEYLLKQSWSPYRATLPRTPLHCHFTAASIPPSSNSSSRTTEDSTTRELAEVRRTRIGIDFPSDFQPASALNRIFIWFTIFTPLHAERLLATVRYLRKHRVPTAQISIVCACAARPALWRVTESGHANDVSISIGILQEWREDRLVPGWHNYSERFEKVVHLKEKLRSQHSRNASKEKDSAVSILTPNL
jgi:uracil phosphoribosyltransferase